MPAVCHRAAARISRPTLSRPLAPTPTNAVPGTPEKQAVLAARRRAGYALWHPGDARGQTAGAGRSRWIQQLPTGVYWNTQRRRYYVQLGRGRGRRIHGGEFRTLRQAVEFRNAILDEIGPGAGPDAWAELLGNVEVMKAALRRHRGRGG
jgi:hypothetical protein